jgi:hypothetical protein
MRSTADALTAGTIGDLVLTDEIITPPPTENIVWGLDYKPAVAQVYVTTSPDSSGNQQGLITPITGLGMPFEDEAFNDDKFTTEHYDIFNQKTVVIPRSARLNGEPITPHTYAYIDLKAIDPERRSTATGRLLKKMVARYTFDQLFAGVMTLGSVDGKQFVCPYMTLGKSTWKPTLDYRAFPTAHILTSLRSFHAVGCPGSWREKVELKTAEETEAVFAPSMYSASNGTQLRYPVLVRKELTKQAGDPVNPDTKYTHAAKAAIHWVYFVQHWMPSSTREKYFGGRDAYTTADYINAVYATVTGQQRTTAALERVQGATPEVSKAKNLEWANVESKELSPAQIQMAANELVKFSVENSGLGSNLSYSGSRVDFGLWTLEDTREMHAMLTEHLKPMTNLCKVEIVYLRRVFLEAHGAFPRAQFAQWRTNGQVNGKRCVFYRLKDRQEMAAGKLPLLCFKGEPTAEQDAECTELGYARADKYCSGRAIMFAGLCWEVVLRCPDFPSVFNMVLHFGTRRDLEMAGRGSCVENLLETLRTDTDLFYISNSYWCERVFQKTKEVEGFDYHSVYVNQRSVVEWLMGPAATNHSQARANLPPGLCVFHGSSTTMASKAIDDFFATMANLNNELGGGQLRMEPAIAEPVPVEVQTEDGPAIVPVEEARTRRRTTVSRGATT